MKKSYSEKLQDPRWQRKRLEIMDRDGYKCRECQSTEKTQTVRHAYYKKGCEPWEYPNESLQTVCMDCHKKRDEAEHRLLRVVAESRMDEIIRFCDFCDSISEFDENNGPLGTVKNWAKEHKDQYEADLLVEFKLAHGEELFPVWWKDFLNSSKTKSPFAHSCLEQAIAAGCFYEEGFANLAIHLKEDFVSLLDNGKTKKLVSSCLEKLGVFVEPDRVFFQHSAA